MSLTVELGGEAEAVVALRLLVPVAIVTDTSGGVLAAALVPGMRDGILDGAVLQPACVTPVQTFQPGLWSRSERIQFILLRAEQRWFIPPVV